MSQIQLSATRITALAITAAVARCRVRTMRAKAAMTATANMVVPPTPLMKIKLKSRIPEISMLDVAIWINSFWSRPSDGGCVGGVSPLPVADCAHMTAKVGDVIGHTFINEVRGSHHYDDGGGGGDGSSSSLENMNIDGFGYDGGAGGVIE